MKKKNIEDEFNVLRIIKKKPISSQRDLAKNLNYSLGKLNYCLNALIKKGFVKIKNFNNNDNKSGYFYVLTLLGLKEKTKLTINFMKKKIKEYEELNDELNEKKK
tara:strand:+ start:83 stop:397 length:315 start_codon:yes stop_codon:yes gene_type:complete